MEPINTGDRRDGWITQTFQRIPNIVFRINEEEGGQGISNDINRYSFQLLYTS